ncbi:MAG: hypothetical protein WKG00_02540 [Polyangiaceae bacterium]
MGLEFAAQAALDFLATCVASGDSSTSVSTLRTRASGSSASSKARSRRVGPSAKRSMARAATKCASTWAKRVSGSRAASPLAKPGDDGRSLGASASTVPTAATATWFDEGAQSRRGLSMTARGMVWVTMRSMTWAMVR